jgi:hypothetical protein
MSVREQRRRKQATVRRDRDIAADKLDTRTWWNGEPAEARIVHVVVGAPEKPTWWFADLVGTVREAVEVRQHGQTIYIDNQGFESGFTPGNGWRKVTTGRGSPQWGHASLTIERVLEDEGK